MREARRAQLAEHSGLLRCAIHLPVCALSARVFTCCSPSTPQARLLCVSLGEAFCPADAAGQQAAATLLRDAPRWAGDAKLMTLAAELISEALVSTEDEQ